MLQKAKKNKNTETHVNNKSACIPSLCIFFPALTGLGLTYFVYRYSYLTFPPQNPLQRIMVTCSALTLCKAQICNRQNCASLSMYISSICLSTNHHSGTGPRHIQFDICKSYLSLLLFKDTWKIARIQEPNHFLLFFSTKQSTIKTLISTVLMFLSGK